MAGTGIGYPFDTGAGIALGAVNGLLKNSLLGSNIGAPGQSFINVPVVNDKLAIYTLVVKDLANPDQAVNGLNYTFPLSPSALTREINAMTNVYDVAGGAKTFGVQRIIDNYGNSPPTFSIEGTTGWQKHSTDGFNLTGLESIAAIKNLFDQYASLNADRQASNNPLAFIMEFYDYFQGEFWRVVPIGRQSIRQDQSRPLLFYYSFRFAATENLASPPVASGSDPVLSALNTPQNQATTSLLTSVQTQLSNYASQTPGALV